MPSLKHAKVPSWHQIIPIIFLPYILASCYHGPMNETPYPSFRPLTVWNVGCIDSHGIGTEAGERQHGRLMQWFDHGPGYHFKSNSRRPRWAIKQEQRFERMREEAAKAVVVAHNVTGEDIKNIGTINGRRYVEFWAVSPRAIEELAGRILQAVANGQEVLMSARGSYPWFTPWQNNGHQTADTLTAYLSTPPIIWFRILEPERVEPVTTNVSGRRQNEQLLQQFD